MKTKNKFLSFIVPAGLLLAGSFSTQAKPSIKELTSKDKAEKVEKQIPRLGDNLKKHSVGIGLGQTFLNSDFAQNGEDQITWDLFYNYAASHSFDFLANFHYSNHDFKGKETTLLGLTAGIKAKAYQFDSFSPYFAGGLGFYSPKMKRDINGSIMESESKTTFGYHFGGGADLKLNNRVSVGLLGIYHNPFDVKQEDQPEVEGSYFKLLMTAFYTF